MYIFVGLVYGPDDESRVSEKSKSGLQAAANKYQWGIIRGIKQLLDEKILVINSVPMGTFPKHCKIIYERKRQIVLENVTLDSIGYINLPIVKQIQRQYKIYVKLKQILKRTTEEVTIVVYSLYRPYLKALKKLKKEFRNFNYTLIVPDLPLQYGIENEKLILRTIQRVLGKSALKLSKYSDNYVLLTDAMKTVLKTASKRTVVIEGIAENGVKEEARYCRGECPIILYTGTIDKALGIPFLVSAFEKLPDGIAQLWIAGRGDYQTELINKSKSNKNIHYLGFCSQKEICEVQKKAAILVNPRSAREEYTKYSFPSKTMEYLMAGKPVIMNKLPGIPQEYYPYLFFFEGEEPEAMALTLKKVLEMDEKTLGEHCSKAIDFIRMEKNACVQARKLIDLNNEGKICVRK